MTSGSHIKRLPSGIYKYPYIYCAWLWAWSAALFAGWTRTSPFASLLAASAFTLASVGPASSMYERAHWSKRLFICAFEVCIAAAVGLVGGGAVWTPRALATNALVFAVYLAFLHAHGLSFSRVYFDLLPNRHTQDSSETAVQYIHAGLSW